MQDGGTILGARERRTASKDGEGPSGAHALLLTGAPGVGKTTVVRRVAERLAGERLRGFTTEETREDGERIGFRLDTFDGRSAVLARAGLRSAHRVGKYGVDLAALEGIAVSALAPEEGATYLVDEIGRMECLSPLFVEAVTALLDSGRSLVATIAARGGGFIERVKRRPGVETWEVTRDNRDGLPERVLAWLGRARERFRP